MGAISSIGAGPMIWDNFSIFRTNCDIAFTRVHAARIFADDAQEKWPSKTPEIFYAFGPQLNAFMSVGILLKYFRRKLLQFE